MLYVVLRYVLCWTGFLSAVFLSFSCDCTDALRISDKNKLWGGEY